MSRLAGNRAIPIVLAAIVVNAIGFGIVMPVLPALVVRLGHLGLDEAARIGGWLFVVFAIGQFFAGPVIGNLGDRFGRRPVMIAAMGAFALDYAVMAAAPTLGWLFAGRLIAGIAGSIMGPASALIADITPQEKRGATFSKVSAAFGFGFVIGPALGGLAASWGVRAPFFLAAAFAVLSALMMALLLPETLATENRRPFRLAEANVIASFRPLAKVGDAAPLLGAWLAWQLASMVWPTTWGFWCAIRLGWNPHAIGWSLVYVGVMMALVQIAVTGRVIRLIGERRAAVIGLASGAACFALYATASHGWQVYAYFLPGALSGLVFPSFRAILSQMVGADRQGALNGGMSSLDSVAAIVAPFLLSQTLAIGVAHHLPGAAFLVAAALAVVALLLVGWRLVVTPRIVPDALPLPGAATP